MNDRTPDERRATGRAPIAVSISLEWRSNGDLRRTRGTTRDISRSGVCAYVEDPLPPNTPVRFEVFFPPEHTAGSSLKAHCSGRILRVENYGRRFAVAALIENREVSESEESGREPNRRSSKRVATAATVVADYPGSCPLVRDLSPTGAFIEDERPFPVGKRFQLRLRRDDAAGEIDVTAVVRRVERQVGMAVEFVALSQSANERLREWAEAIQANPAPRTHRSSQPPERLPGARP